MIFTFYSFKGGVGRSMTMATVGYLLAQRGLKVLVIDFDLEAPGLERYFFDDPAQLAQIRSNPGLIDLVLAFKRALTSETEFQRATFKDWPTYVVEAIPQTTGGGLVDLMPSGQRYPEDRYSEYALAVRGFDWQDFFHNWRGDRFFDWLRQELTSPDRGYDAVLVDSRTGVTEMGGVCAYQLADVAILLCAPNYQNLDGTRAVVTDFRSDAVVALRGGRALEILVVPARVEQSDPAKRDRFFEALEGMFGTDAFPKTLADAGLDYRRLAIPYRAELAIIERLVDETAPGHGGALAADSEGRAPFERLTDAMTLLSDGGRWTALKEQASARLAGRIGPSATESIADVSQRSAGYDAFVTCQASDREQVQLLVTELTARQLNVWLDVRQVDAGEVWQDSSSVAVQYSQALVVGIGESAPDQAYWRISQEFRARRKPIVPVILPGCKNAFAALERYGFSAEVERVELRNGLTGATVDQIADALRRDRRLSAQPTTASAPASPYPGAAPFSEEQAAHLLGREADVERLMAAFADRDVVLLEGAAGIGKTSVVQAGLVPRLRRAEGSFGLIGNETVWTVVTTDLTGSDGLDSLDRLASSGQEPLLCVIDGVDSFPLNGRQDGRDDRLARLTRALTHAGPRRRFLLIWRGSLPDRERNQAVSEWTAPGRRATLLSIDPLPAASLRDAIEKPASAAGHLFEPGLVDRLLQDAGTQPGAVAQIQIALTDIWSARRRGWLTNKAYDVGGGIAGRFQTRLERCLQECKADLGDAPITLVKNLVTLDARLSPSPAAREWGVLESIDAIATPDALGARDRLAGERLIDLWRDAQNRLLCALAQPVAGPTIENLVHAEADFLLWRQRFTTYLHQFVESDRSPSATIPDAALGEAEHWLSEKANQLSGDERILIEQSREATRSREAAERARQRAENERLARERDRADEERQRAEAQAVRADQESARAEASRGRANSRARWLAVAAVVVVGFAAWSAMLLRQSQHQQKQIDLQAELERARRLGAADPTAGAAALAYALETHESAQDPELVDAVLRAIFSLPDEALAHVRLVHDLVHDGPLRGSFFGPNSGIVTFSDRLQSWTLDGKPRGEGPRGAVVAACLSADEQQILTVWADGRVQALDAEGRVLRELPAIGQQVTAAAFSRDTKRFVTTLATGASQVRELAGKVVAEFGPELNVNKLALSPDGAFVVTIAGLEARLWNVATRRTTVLSSPASRPPSQEREMIRDAVFSDDGRRFATTVPDGTLTIWDISGRVVRTIRAHTAAINRVAFSPDGLFLATASSDRTARVWNVEAGGAESVLAGHTDKVLAVGFSHDGKQIVTGSADRTARVWERTGVLLERFTETDEVRDAVFDSTNRWILTRSTNGTVRLWNADSRIPSVVLGDKRPVESAELSPDGTRVVTSHRDATAEVWNLETGAHTSLVGHSGPVVHAEFSPDGREVLTASTDKTARLWNPEDGSMRVLLQLDAGALHAAFSPDGMSVITTSVDGTAGVWTLQGQLVTRFKHDDYSVRYAAISADGQRIVTVSDDGRARIWDRTGLAVAVLSGDAGGESVVNRTVFAPNGKSVLTASTDSTARLFDLSGRDIQMFRGHTQSVTDANFSADGRLIVTGSADGTARVWDLQGRTLTVLEGEWVRLNSLAVSPDGQLIVTAAADGVPRLWNARAQQLAELHGHTQEVRRAAFSGNGQRLVTVSADAARVWPVTRTMYLRRVAQLGLPCLTKSELQELLPIDSAQAVQFERECRRAKGLEPRP